jgi:hypothetical protein
MRKEILGGSQRRAEPDEQELASSRAAGAIPDSALSIAPATARSFTGEGRDAFKSFEEKMYR